MKNMYDPSHKKLVSCSYHSHNGFHQNFYNRNFLWNTLKYRKIYHQFHFPQVFLIENFDCRFENFDCRFLLSFSRCLIFDNFYFQFDNFIVGAKTKPKNVNSNVQIVVLQSEFFNVQMVAQRGVWHLTVQSHRGARFFQPIPRFWKPTKLPFQQTYFRQIPSAHWGVLDMSPLKKNLKIHFNWNYCENIWKS